MLSFYAHREVYRVHAGRLCVVAGWRCVTWLQVLDWVCATPSEVGDVLDTRRWSSCTASLAPRTTGSPLSTYDDAPLQTWPSIGPVVKIQVPIYVFTEPT